MPQGNLVTHDRPTSGSSDRPHGVRSGRLILLSYAFADFINAQGGEDAITEHYREQFTPRAKQPKPETAVAVWAICAETEAEANFLASSF